jgi:hypothetical protein
MALTIPTTGLKYGTMGTAPDLNIGGSAATVIIWVYPISYTPGGCIFSRSNTTATSPFHQYFFGLDNSPRAILFYAIGGTFKFAVVNNNTTYPVGSWSMMRGTYDGSNIKLYVDKNSTPVATTSAPGTITQYPTWVNNIGVAEYVKGTQSQYGNASVFGHRILDKVVSQAENDNLYDNPGCYVIPGTNLKGRWRLGTESGLLTTETDLSGNGNNLTGVNSPSYVADIFYPCVPQNVLASDGVYEDKTVITWDSSYGALTYNVYRADSEGGVYSSISTGETGLTYNDTAGVAGQVYWYKVSAVNGTGESSLSTADSGYKKETPAGIHNIYLNSKIEKTQSLGCEVVKEANINCKILKEVNLNGEIQ